MTAEEKAQKKKDRIKAKKQARIDSQKKALDQITAEIKSVKEENAKMKKNPNFKTATPGQLFGGAPNTTRQLGERAYSFVKAASLATRYQDEKECVEEYQIHQKLEKMYVQRGYSKHSNESILVPFSVNFMPRNLGSEHEKLVQEIREKTAPQAYDPDEVRFIQKKYASHMKTINTYDMTSGGTFVGPAMFMDFADLQRNLEVFVNAGASETSLPPSGRGYISKLTNSTTAYMITEAGTITPANASTGGVVFIAKKLGSLTILNGEFLRFSSPGSEALLTQDMARAIALKADSQMLYGTGGSEIKGLTTYDTATAWTQGVDKLLLYEGSGVGDDGNTFVPEDLENMLGTLPDEVEATAWVMRRKLLSYIRNRRADATSADDGKGQFLFQRFMRDAETGKIADMLNDIKVVRSSQVASDLTKGSGEGLTQILAGRWSDWVIARSGIMEMLVDPYTLAGSDQRRLITIQQLDAAPRHAASFVMYDDVIQG